MTGLVGWTSPVPERLPQFKPSAPLPRAAPSAVIRKPTLRNLAVSARALRLSNGRVAWMQTRNLT